MSIKQDRVEVVGLLRAFNCAGVLSGSTVGHVLPLAAVLF